MHCCLRCNSRHSVRRGQLGQRVPHALLLPACCLQLSRHPAGCSSLKMEVSPPRGAEALCQHCLASNQHGPSDTRDTGSQKWGKGCCQTVDARAAVPAMLTIQGLPGHHQDEVLDRKVQRVRGVVQGVGCRTQERCLRTESSKTAHEPLPPEQDTGVCAAA